MFIQGLYRGYIGIIEKKMEATIEALGFRKRGLGLCSDRFSGLGFRAYREITGSNANNGG